MSIIIDGTLGVVQETVGAETLPMGTTDQRPIRPLSGMIRFNATTNALEWYSAASALWFEVNGQTAKALSFTFNTKAQTWVIPHNQNNSFFQLKITKDDGTIVNAPYSSDLNSITVSFTYPIRGTVSLIFGLV